MRSARLLMASLLFAGWFSAAAAADRKAAQSPTDGDGNALPSGAVARLGSTRWRLPYEPRGFFLSPDGRGLAVTGDYTTTTIIDAETGRRLQCLGSPTATRSLRYGLRPPAAFSPDGKRIAYLDVSKSCRVLKIRDLAGERERCIDFRNIGSYQPRLTNELDKKTRSPARGEYITALAFSPDGKVLVAAVHFRYTTLLRVEEGDVICRWEVSSGKELGACSGHARTISGIFFSADSKTMTTTSEKDFNGTLRFWDAVTGKEYRHRRQKGNGPLFCAAYSPDGKWFAAGGKKEVLLWDAATETIRHRLAMPTREVRSLAFTPDSKLLAAGGGTALRLWETRTAKLMRETPSLPQPVAALAFSVDGKKLFLGQEGEQVVRRLKAATLKPDELHGHASPVSCLAFTADNQRLLTAASVDDWRCWDARSGKPCLSGAADKKLLQRALLASLNRKWSRTGAFRYVTISIEWENSKEGITGSNLVYSADGKRLLLEQQKDNRAMLIVVDTESGKKLRELPKTDDNARTSLSPDGRMLAMTASNRLTFLEVDSGLSRQYAYATEQAMYHASAAPQTFSPDGSRFAFLGQDKVHVVSVRNGRLLAAIVPEAVDRLVELNFSPDGKTLCLSRFDGPQTLWEVASGQSVHSYSGRGCLFSPGNRLLAISNEDALCLYDLYSGKKLRTCKDAAGFTDSLAFSGDDQRLATVSQDTTVLLWDCASPETRDTMRPLDKAALERLWEKLQTRKASAAYKAMGRLIADPQHALLFLRGRLSKAPTIDENRLLQWIADLDSDSFDKRETASRELGRFGPLAEIALRKALKGPTSLEMRRRIKELLRPFEAKEMRLSAEALAQVRAIQVLEGIGTSEARQFLKHLAEGAEGVVRTRDAQEALHRMR